MKCRLLSLLIVAGSWGSAAFGQTPVHELRAFLFNLGFEDHVAKVQEYQDRGLYYNEMNRRQQERHKKSYEAVNAARETALLLFQEIEPRLQDPARQKAWVEMTAKMLALQPLPPKTNYPAQIMSLPEGQERSDALNEWLNQQRRQQMETHTRQVVADLAGMIYGENLQNRPQEIARLYNLVATLIDRVYLDPLIGQTRFLGRAMAALTARHEKLQPNSQLTAQLKTTLNQTYKLHLENFIGNEWVIDGPRGPQKIAIENGSMFATRNLSVESLQIAFAAVAADAEVASLARQKGLLGQVRAAPFFFTAKDAAEGMTTASHIKDRIQQMNLPMTQGFSHVGYVMMKRDPKTGIQMSYTVDNYPHITADTSQILSNPGGVRVTGLEQVLDPSHHSKIVIGNINHQLFHEWAQESYRELGYPKDGIISDAAPMKIVDGEHEPRQRPKSDPWRIQISQTEFHQLHEIKDSKQWYQKASDNFVQKGLMDMFYRGVYFQWVTAGVSYKGGAYCSQTGFLAWLQSTGVSIERFFQPGMADKFKTELAERQRKTPGYPSADTWSWHVRFLAQLGKWAEQMQEKKILPKVTAKILGSNLVQQSMFFVGLDIIAPSGLMAQKHVDTKVVPLAPRKMSERVRTPYRRYQENDRALKLQVDELLPRSNPRFQRFLTHKLDPSDLASASMRDMEFRFGIYGSMGLKTPGVSTSSVAFAGASEALAKVTKEWENRGRPQRVQMKCQYVFQ